MPRPSRSGRQRRTPRAVQRPLQLKLLVGSARAQRSWPDGHYAMHGVARGAAMCHGIEGPFGPGSPRGSLDVTKVMLAPPTVAAMIL